MSSLASTGARRGRRRKQSSEQRARRTASAQPARSKQSVEASEGSDDDGDASVIGAGGSADEATSKKHGAEQTVKSTQPNHAPNDDNWNSIIHTAMLQILFAVFEDLQELRETSDMKGSKAGTMILGYINSIEGIGQQVTGFARSKLQTRLLLSKTLSLCFDMVRGGHCRLAKDYPREYGCEDNLRQGDSDFDYDFTTTDSNSGEWDVEESDDDGDDFWKDEGRGVARRRSTGSGSSGAEKQVGGRVSNRKMKNIKAKLPKGKGKPQTGKRDGKTEAKTTGKHKGSRAGAEKRNDKVVGSGAGNRDGATGSTVRKRFNAAASSLATRRHWATAGQPHAKIYTSCNEIIATIFVDSFFRQMLSNETLDESLSKIEKMITWADQAGRQDDATSVLVDGLSLAHVGLEGISFTVRVLGD